MSVSEACCIYIIRVILRSKLINVMPIPFKHAGQQIQEKSQNESAFTDWPSSVIYENSSSDSMGKIHAWP